MTKEEIIARAIYYECYGYAAPREWGHEVDSWLFHDRLACAVIAALSSAGYEIVPRGLLELSLGVLDEAEKHLPVTGSNFDDDLALSRAQLRLAIAPQKEIP